MESYLGLPLKDNHLKGYFKMPRSRLFFLSLFACACISAGCDTVTPSFSNGAPQLVASPDNVSAMLADAADRASTALQTLAAVEYARSPNTTLSPVGNAPVELRRAVTVNWIGPVEVLTRTLAERAGYSFQTIGSTPPAPVVVSIDAENKPVIDVLRDVGLQLGTRGDVRVDSSRRVVEIHYPPVTGGGA